MDADPYQRQLRSIEGFADAVAAAESVEDVAELLRILRRWHARGRRDRTLTYQELAEKTGWSRSAIADYFTGHTLPPTDRFDALLEALSVPPSERRTLASARDRVEEARRRIQHSESREPPRPESAPGSSSQPRGVWQLPADTGLFIGRAGEVGTILGLAGQAVGIGRGAVVISAIDGMGGVGKTALAVHTGHLLADRFPDGVLFLELHTHTVGVAARTAFDVQGTALVALGQAPQAIPADADARAAAYRARLAGTRTLLVVDDVADETQVRTLLPGTGGCLVLATSRNRLKALDDAEAMRLDVLGRDEAIELFCGTAGAGRASGDDTAVAQIVELCGDLPLAIRIAGALLRSRTAWSPRYLLSNLTANLAGLEAFDDGQRRLPAVLDVSYRHLPEQARALFRRLGQIPGSDTDPYAAAALLDCDPKTAGRLLAQLADRSMLTEHTAGRWRMHDLLREHAHAHAVTGGEDTADQRRNALDRLLHYYAHTSHTGSVPIARMPRPGPDGPPPAHAPDLTDPQAARAWLRTEHRNLDAAGAYAHAHRLDHHTIALAAGLAEILNADGHWSRALEVHQAAETAAGHDRPAARAAALVDLGRARHLTGDLSGATADLERALEIFRQIGDRLGEANALNNLGQMRYQVADFPGATVILRRAVDIFRRIGSRLGDANVLKELGRVRQQTGDFPGATAVLQQALDIFRQIGNRLGEANVLNNLGQTRYLTGDYPGAAHALERALAICEQIGNRLNEANILGSLGEVRYLTGDFPAAAAAHARALEVFRRIGNRIGEANSLNDLGKAWHAIGDLAEAADVQEQALAIFREIGQRLGEAWALNFYAATVAALGDRPRALTLYQQALAMNRELHKPDDEAISLEGIADHHLAAGDVD